MRTSTLKPSYARAE